MLEQMRRQGASIFIYLIFGLLIVIFVINFAPSRGRGEGGCSTASNTVVTVDGQEANQTAYYVAYASRSVSGRSKVYVALDTLIRRELLAQAAAERGIRTTGELVDEEIKRGYFFLGGERIDISNQLFDEVDGERFFNVKKWKGWVASLNNISAGSYRDEQARGLQAAMMSELIEGSVRVSRDEALANYLYENNTVTYDVVAFEPAKYRRAMRLTDADLKRFLETHNAEVQARYKADERTYKAVKPQLALREIYIPKALPGADKPADDKAAKPDDKAAKPDDKAATPADAKAAKPDDKAGKPADAKPAKPDDQAKKADKKPAAGDAPKPYGLASDVAKAKLEAVRASIAAGKLTFAEAEKQLAADSSEDAPAENGDRGWRSVDNPELGEKALNDAAKTLKPGELTPVIVTERGTYLVMATDKREGDLSYDQVKNEIASTLAKDVWSKEAAKRDALEALAKAQASGKPLDQLYDRELVKPNNGMEDLLNNPNLTPEQRQQIFELMKQQRHGSLEVHEQDVPVAWYADADGSAHGSAAPTGTPPAAPAAGSATGGAGSGAAAAAGSSAGSAAAAAVTPAATPAAPPAPTTIEPSKDVLPQFGEVAKAKLNRLGPAPRQPKMPGLGSSKEAVDALFEELGTGNLAKKVYEGDNGSYVVLQLINRAQPNVADFDKTADAEIARMQEARGKAAVHAWLKARCEVLTKANKIRPAADKIRETDDKGNPAPTVYQPCMSFDYLGR